MKCEVCASLDQVVLFDVAGKGILKVEVCSRCFENGRFKHWLEAQFELALAANPEWTKRPDGKWQRVPG